MASDRVQSLVDGRLMDNHIYGGPGYWNLPILLEDIEPIEMLRDAGGPTKTFAGVTNVITKEPEDVLGWFGLSTITELGKTYTHLRWATRTTNSLTMFSTASLPTGRSSRR